MQDLTTFISNHLSLSIAAIILFTLLILVEALRAKRRVASLNTTQMIQMINHQKANVIDIRAKESYRNGHIIGAQSMTAKEISAPGKRLERYKTKPLIIVCNNGSESQKIAADLAKQGYNTRALAGGLRSWSEANLPLVKE